MEDASRGMKNRRSLEKGRFVGDYFGKRSRSHSLPASKLIRDESTSWDTIPRGGGSVVLYICPIFVACHFSLDEIFVGRRTGCFVILSLTFLGITRSPLPFPRQSNFRKEICRFDSNDRIVIYISFLKIVS